MYLLSQILNYRIIVRNGSSIFCWEISFGKGQIYPGITVEQGEGKKVIIFFFFHSNLERKEEANFYE